LTEGVQEALWQLGGVPRTHRTDRLSAAYRNLSSRDDEAARYAEFCRHYGMEPTRNFKRNGPPQRVVDYRHLIGPLIRKPQAFRHSVFRDELFPSSVFRRAWEVLDQRLEPRKACRVYVGLLHLAAMQGCEVLLADHLTGTAVAPPMLIAAPTVMVPAPNLAVYDELLRMPILGDAA
jgi:hypothetical protein